MEQVFERVVVTAPSRLHLGLHDCGYASRRLFGGSGVAIQGPQTQVTASRFDGVRVELAERVELSDRAQQDIEVIKQKIADKIGGALIEVTSTAPEHRGFGSKTSLLLAIAHAADLLHNQPSPERRSFVSQLTQRGGTSGIGINTFWDGGFIADGGHTTTKVRSFGPSAERQPEHIPPVIARIEMPENWVVNLFCDPNTPIIQGEEERNIFIDIMPVPELENLRAIAATYHGLIPAIIESDLTALGYALQDMNSTGMKKRELALQTPAAQAFLAAAWDNEVPGGLTSFGPTIFTISEGADSKIAELADQYDLTHLGSYPFNNVGAKYIKQ